MFCEFHPRGSISTVIVIFIVSVSKDVLWIPSQDPDIIQVLEVVEVNEEERTDEQGSDITKFCKFHVTMCLYYTFTAVINIKA
jgi:hypothetical protein